MITLVLLYLLTTPILLLAQFLPDSDGYDIPSAWEGLVDGISNVIAFPSAFFNDYWTVLNYVITVAIVSGSLKFGNFVYNKVRGSG